MTLEDRIAEINALLPAVQNKALVDFIERRLVELTHQLIGENDEQVRGRIKELRDLMDLPQTLQAEREGLTAELPETDSASL